MKSWTNHQGPAVLELTLWLLIMERECGKELGEAGMDEWKIDEEVHRSGYLLIGLKVFLYFYSWDRHAGIQLKMSHCP